MKESKTGGHVAHLKEKRNVCIVLVGISEGEHHLQNVGLGGRMPSKVGREETGWKDGDRLQVLVTMVISLQVPEYLHQHSKYYTLKKDLAL
jgi:hypothetical protein